jgi:hypothetical protein
MQMHELTSLIISNAEKCTPFSLFVRYTRNVEDVLQRSVAVSCVQVLFLFVKQENREIIRLDKYFVSSAKISRAG